MNRLKELQVSGLLDDYGALLGDKQRDLLELYYDEDLSLSEIAELKGMTRQGVSDSIRRARVELEQMEAALGLAARRRAIGDAVSRLRAASGQAIDPLKTELLAVAQEIEAQL